MQTETQTPQTPTSQAAPRLRRSAAAVIAQYIEDLAHPAQPAPCLA